MIPKKVARIYKLIDNIALKGRNNILDYQVLIDDLVSSKDYDNLLVCLEIYYKVNIYKIRKVSDIKDIKIWESILFYTNTSLVRKLKKLFERKGIYQVGIDVFLENYMIDSDRFYNLLMDNGFDTNNYTLLGDGFLNDSKFIIDEIINIEDSKKIVYVKDFLNKTTYFLSDKTILNQPDIEEIKSLILSSLEVKLGEFREIGSYTEESRYLLKNKEYSKITKTRKDFVEVVKVGNYEPMLFDSIDDDMSEDENLYNRYVDAVEFILL